MKNKKILTISVCWSILIVFLIWTVFPIFWAIVTSLKTLAESYSLSIIPYLQFDPSPRVWTRLFTEDLKPLLNALKNSVVVAIVSSFISLALGCLTGFALSRFVFHKWKNKDIATYILSLRMFPPVVILIPIFLMMRTFRMLDSLPSVILTHILYNLPLAVWLMMDFFNQLPKEIEESALVDGCSALGAFLRISIPLSSSGLVAVYVLCFIFSWSEFLFALGLTYNKAVTFPVMIAGVLTPVALDFGRVSAFTLLAILPPTILTLLMSRYLVRGLTLGAVKG